MIFRSQPYRIKWPLTPSQVEGIDEMFEILFRGMKGLSGSTSPTTSLSTSKGIQGPPGIDGDSGEDGVQGPPGQGIQGIQGIAGTNGTLGPPGQDGDPGEDALWQGSLNTITEGQVMGLVGDLALKAPLASPGLTGTPTSPTPATGDNSTDIATTAFVTTAVANAIAGVNPAVAVQAASAAILPNTPTYNNGVAGIGAFITTATTNTALVVDGYTPVLGGRILVKNEGDASGLGASRNGVYTVTQVAAIGLAWILTRALDYDMPSDINNTGAIPVVNGTVNALTSWLLTSLVTTVGTDALTYTKFSLAPLTALRSSAFNSADQSIANNTVTALTFDTNSYDAGGIHSTTVNKTRFTVPTGGAGLYLVTGQVTWVFGGAPRNVIEVQKNGTTVISATEVDYPAGGVTVVAPQILVVDVAADADYYEFFVFQNSGGAVLTTHGNGNTYGTVTRLQV